jgi:hypothetical protein
MRIFLQRNGKASLRAKIPYEFAQRHDLKPGDQIAWREEADGSVRLKFIKIDGEQEVVVGAAA